MSLIAGTTVTLHVEREVSPYGFFLNAGDQDVMLHYTELTEKVKAGDKVEVFIFFDTEDRLAATMKKPFLTLGEMALLEVADIHPRLGCFLEMGLGRQLLLPIRELPELPELRPQVGDYVFAIMEHDKQGRLRAKLAGEQELAPLALPAPESWMGQTVTARVYKPLQMGTFVLVDAGVLGFGIIGMVHSSERSRLLRLGEQFEARVSHIREDGRVNLSMGLRKEVGMDVDSAALLEFLNARPGGAMPYSDATPPDIIKQRFGISKSAFKRALGKLMKEGHITQKENWTYLVAKDNEEGTTEGQEETTD
ncbi:MULTISPECIES: S1-like domain-containing RNA-binding protein [Paenibacillus]|jgi:predicted RNA-binding protein (virulence factor B family)|uniref:RNA-binding protein n=1 Tax=Paenibacillus odorifer TaxID=189426 RepID=A0A1R0XDB7_9BACL|nr:MULTISPECIES: S1-like domain-containing RNA-binding protein [Paenibacillus]AIQ73130.1 RNA-binding protein [Paenibacillus odorifer]ETT68990.1 RNA-binding S1 domain-containing protein [Paenibacillus sp. FSL H8-237]MDH6425937.1 putative RNA-binding protein (virulence factor B family) [Paenibacillus sp. PastH-4]MDH6441958.1 putative RNA-binding protein (virulence factor B family) [Paenibacillus sp. PastF-4]MDH6527327.1 putative RNA-binding protein (virulence factor B family) [Paenibacillus sp. 